MSIHPIQAAWDRLFQALDEADVALTDDTDDTGEEYDKP